MINLENWTEITDGLYRYAKAISAVMRFILYIMLKTLLNGPLLSCLCSAVEDELDVCP